MDFIAYGLVFFKATTGSQVSSLENINDIMDMQEVIDVEAEYGEYISDALSSYLTPARENDELQLETFDCDYYDPTKVVFLEEDEGWKDHMFGDVITPPFALEESLCENMETSTDGENVGPSSGIALWALLPGETEDEPYFVVPYYHPLLEHGYSKHYYFTDAARLWVFATSPEEATAHEKATSKKNLPKENIPAEILPERNISEEIVIDVMTVEEGDILEVTAPVAAANVITPVAVTNEKETLICKILLEKINLKKRKYNHMVEDEEVDVRAELNLKEKRRRASLKEEYDKLRKCLPSLRPKPTASMAKIMKESLDYVNYLERKEEKRVKKLKKVKFESEALKAQLKAYVIFHASQLMISHWL